MLRTPLTLAWFLILASLLSGCSKRADYSRVDQSGESASIGSVGDDDERFAVEALKKVGIGSVTVTELHTNSIEVASSVEVPARQILLQNATEHGYRLIGER